jgi:inorganic pyrophosphatase
MTTIEVFIENEAGTAVKHHYDERTLELQGCEKVGAAYPWPYGFVPGTLAEDGDAADCFVITAAAIPTGTMVAGEPVALLEQTEGGEVDHNLIVIPPGAPRPDLEAVRDAVAEFAREVFAGLPGREIVLGRTLGADAARAYLEECARAFREGIG